MPQGGAATWRLDVDAAGSGVTGDLLAHCLDTAIWINGGISSLTAMTETFIKERKHAETGKVQPVGIDDAAAVLTRFANGSLGTFESTRYARGHKAAYTLEINGEQRLASPGTCTTSTACSGSTTASKARMRGWTIILVTDGDHPYLGKWWVPGPHHRLRAQLHPPGRRLPRWPQERSKPAAPTFREALETNRVCDAIIASRQVGQVGEPVKLGFDLLLWTTHVTEQHWPIIDQLKAAGYDGVEIPMFEGTVEPLRDARASASRTSGSQSTGIGVIAGGSAISPDKASAQQGASITSNGWSTAPRRSAATSWPARSTSRSASSPARARPPTK